ncbi:type II 3-dehydroquinate dehydratase [Kiritimatiella glycovorans]|uniref:3-dehydroquinate dehydratase n=1 Tax=Kiritimatiella glycovorans TaxID=1307763 RepID=A0A0G3EGH8_9BACT|nr:type II 3-dehydroquinate dehydratase [Kiritimatiella glycovorans]AKJ63890.1 3-dehydroquinate dehydratase [Kiritimatiella glycovorans]
MNILVLNGPNLQLLGTREPELYGVETLESIRTRMEERAGELAEQLDEPIGLEFRQSNHEGDLVDWIGAAPGQADGLVINPAAYTHTSLALADALKAVADRVPAVEVHLTSIQAREPVRHASLTAPACIGQIAGFGGLGYVLALEALVDALSST